MRLILKSLFLLSLIGCELIADDWPQWMGPQRDAVWRESGIVERFPAEGLSVKWRTPIHGGYAGPAVARGRVFVPDYVRRKGDAANNPGTRSNISGSERLLCLDVETGDVVWKYEYNCPYEISYPAGPRVTPTVDGDRVYSLGAHGHLACLEIKTGDVVWKRHLEEDYKTKAPVWGFSAHPLIDGEKLICIVGGKGSVAVAFNKKTGKEIWRSISASESGYCPPSIIEAAGKRQLLIWDADKVNSLDPESGKVYWSVALKPSYGMSIAQPRKYKNFLFASGIGNISGVIQLDQEKPDAEIYWRGNNRNSAYCSNATPFIQDGTVYAVDCEKSSLIAFDLESGDRHWATKKPAIGDKRGRHGTAFIVKHEDRFFLFSETGDLILANLTPDKYEELGRFHVLEPTGEAFGRDVVWSHPAFANRCVFARNDKEIVCVSLAK